MKHMTERVALRSFRHAVSLATRSAGNSGGSAVPLCGMRKRLGLSVTPFLLFSPDSARLRLADARLSLRSPIARYSAPRMECGSLLPLWRRAQAVRKRWLAAACCRPAPHVGPPCYRLERGESKLSPAASGRRVAGGVKAAASCRTPKKASGPFASRIIHSFSAFPHIEAAKPPSVHE